MAAALLCSTVAGAHAQTGITAESGLLRWGALKNEVTHYARLGGQGSDIYTALSLDFQIRDRWWLGGRFLWSDTDLNVWACGGECEESWFYDPQPFHARGELEYSIDARWRQIAITAGYRPTDFLHLHFGPGLATLACEYRICGSSPMGNLYLDMGARLLWNVTPHGALGLSFTASPLLHRESHWTVISELVGAKEWASETRYVENENVRVVPISLSITVRIEFNGDTEPVDGD